MLIVGVALTFGAACVRAPADRPSARLDSSAFRDKTTRRPGLLSSPETGSIAITDMFGNTPSPFTAKRLSVVLLHPSDGRIFATLMHAHAILAHLTIADPSDGMRFTLSNVVVKSERSMAYVKRQIGGHGGLMFTLQAARVLLKCGPPTCLHSP